jgi:hypothetical protein
MKKKLVRSLLAALALVAAVPASAHASVPPRPLDARGCNHAVCVYVEGNASGFTYWAQATDGGILRGHFYMEGPNFARRWPATEEISLPPSYVSETFRSFGAGPVCAEILYVPVGGFPQSMGRACVTVS